MAAPRLEVKYLKPLTWEAYRGSEMVARAGLTEVWEGRAYAWFDDRGLTRREWALATRMVQEGLRLYLQERFRRIEIAVYKDHVAAHQWARKLGFQLEGQPAKFMPNGEAGFLYVRFGDGEDRQSGQEA